MNLTKLTSWASQRAGARSDSRYRDDNMRVCVLVLAGCWICDCITDFRMGIDSCRRGSIDCGCRTSIPERMGMVDCRWHD